MIHQVTIDGVVYISRDIDYILTIIRNAALEREAAALQFHKSKEEAK